MLEGSHGSRTDCHNPAPRIERAIDLVRSFTRDDIRLAVKFVIFDTLDTDRLKSSQAHMKRNLGGFDTTLTNTVKNLRSKVQASGWSCDRTAFVRVNSLITFPVFRIVLSINIRRQGHMAKSFDLLKKIRRSLETDSSLPEAAPAHNFC